MNRSANSNFRPTRQWLWDKGKSWLFESGWLEGLETCDQDLLLSRSTIQTYAAGDAIVRQGQTRAGIFTVLYGRVVITSRGEDGTERELANRGPGNIIGERSLLSEGPARATVAAMTEVGTLHLPFDAAKEALRASRPFALHVANLSAIRDRIDELRGVLEAIPLFRGLGATAIDLLLESSILETIKPKGGVERRELGDAAQVVVRGMVAISPRGGEDKTFRLSSAQGPGSVFNLGGALLSLPAECDVLVENEAEILTLPGRPLRSIARTNPHAWRRITREGYSLRSGSLPPPRRKAFVTVLVNGGGTLADLTFALGLVDGFRSSGDDATLVLESDRLIRSPSERVTFDVDGLRWFEYRVASSSALCPSPSGGVEPLLRSLVLEKDQLVVLMDRGLVSSGVAELADAIVDLGQDDGVQELPDELGKTGVLVLRPNSRRVPHGRYIRAPAYPNALVESAELSPAMRRALGRLVRVLKGQTVGVALGGGGAWGYAHVALLEALEENGIPVDLVAGSSFGAVVGALYAAGGLPLVRELVLQKWRVMRGMALWPIDGYSLGRMIDELTDRMPTDKTEIPFFPMTANLTTGEPAIFTQGTLGHCVAASGGFPPFFPAVRRGPDVLVDGAFLCNVPASSVWRAGADFVVASNVVPKVVKNFSSPIPIATNAWGPATRFGHLLQATYLLMRQNGIDGCRSADVAFDFWDSKYGFYEFHRANDIVSASREKLASELPRLRGAYRSLCSFDVSNVLRES